MNAASIKATLAKKVQSMTLSRTTAGAYNPVTGGATATVTTYAVKGITTSYGLSSINKSDSLILSGDKQAIIEAVTIEPMSGDTLTIQGTIWKVISVDSIAPAGANMLHKCQIRK